MGKKTLKKDLNPYTKMEMKLNEKIENLLDISRVLNTCRNK